MFFFSLCYHFLERSLLKILRGELKSDSSKDIQALGGGISGKDLEGRHLKSHPAGDHLTMQAPLPPPEPASHPGSLTHRPAPCEQTLPPPRSWLLAAPPPPSTRRGPAACWTPLGSNSASPYREPLLPAHSTEFYWEWHNFLPRCPRQK